MSHKRDTAGVPGGGGASAPGGGGGAGAATLTECRAVGVVASANTTPLANALRGICSRYNRLHVYEAVLLVPGKGTSIKVQRRARRDASRANPLLEKLPDRWCVVWESDPNRGPAFRELPAAVREVCESHCFCPSAPDFWKSLGAQLQYDMIKDGNEYICHHEGFEMRVQLVRILALTQPGNPDSPSKVMTTHYLLDVATRVPEGQHMDAARAVGSFGQSRLSPLVVLQRADRPIG